MGAEIPPRPALRANEDTANTTPAFIKEFSRENSTEERDTLAQKIRSERAEHREKHAERDRLSSDIENLERKLEEHNEASFIKRISEYLETRAVKESLAMRRAEKQKIESTIPSDTPRERGKRAIAELYSKERARWAQAPYAKEDIARYFTEENLSSLSIEEYALLLRRFPSEMVTHVTRQGIRDHVGMVYHTMGAGAFHNGFEKMAAAGTLESPLSVALTEAQKEDDLMQYLSFQAYERPFGPPETRAEAEESLARELGQYSDRNAVHFAAETVADFYYGSERSNEIFVAFPSAFIAAQYRFGNSELTGTNDEMHNDVYVWDTEQRGMKLDAGLVFIPKDARVDPATGSRYEIGPDGVPLEHESVQTIADWIHDPLIPSMAVAVQEATGHMREDEVPPIEEWEALAEAEPNHWNEERQKVVRVLLPMKRSLEAAGVVDPRITKAIVSYRGADAIRDALRREVTEAFLGKGVHARQMAERLLTDAGVRYAEAKDTISAQEFWERHFNEHPEHRPSKIIYYEGTSPTRALYEWRRNEGIKKEAADQDIGFSEHRVGSSSAAAMEGVERFESLMRKAIDDRFPKD